MLDVDFSKRVGQFHLQPRFSAGTEFVVLFGPSGSGKTLTLQALAGLLTPDEGRIALPAGTAFDSNAGVNLPPQRRGVGYVVQNLALFPHLSVAENIAFALNRWPGQRRQERVLELTKLLGLEGLESRLPRSISGGQQQRVALGRALAAQPDVLLLDEPFSALDAPIRTSLRREVARLQRDLGLLVIFVTHDLQEAYSLADRMVVYDAGTVLQSGTREEIFERPTTGRVAELTEARNVLDATVTRVEPDFIEVASAAFSVRIRKVGQVAVGDEVSLVIRPEHVSLAGSAKPEGSSHDTMLEARIEDETATSVSRRLYLRLLRDSLPTDTLLEADISLEQYDALGVAAKPAWHVVLPMAKMLVLPRV